MEKYKNLSGNSGVIAYTFGEYSITVQFSDGEVYQYTYESAGKRNVEKMKKLAIAGKGLSSFISRTVKERYAEKVK
jgi:hypothetical protein